MQGASLYSKYVKVRITRVPGWVQNICNQNHNFQNNLNKITDIKLIFIICINRYN